MYSELSQRIAAVKFNDGQGQFDFVRSALSLAAVKEKDIRKPYEAYVLPLTDTPHSLVNDSFGAVEQLTTEFGVLIGIQSRQDKTGEKGNELLENVLVALRTNLLGHQPCEGFTAITLGASGLVRMASNGIWWMQRFKTTQTLESTYDHY